MQRPARPFSIRLIAACSALAACASHPLPPAPPATPNPDASTSTSTSTSTPAPKPAPEPAFPYPWLALPYGSILIVSDHVPDAWLAGPPTADDPSLVSEMALRPLDRSRLPAALSAQIGRELDLVGATPGAPCRVKITGLVALAWLDSEVDDASQLYPADGPELTREQFAAKTWELGRKTIAAQYQPLAEGGCDSPYLAAPPAEMPPLYTASQADEATTAKALAAVRGHSLWAAQDDAYQRSVALAKKHRKKLVAAGYASELPKVLPAHWDGPVKDHDWTLPGVTTWTDPRGGPAYHLVNIGNDVSCAAPQAWFVYDADFTQALAYGLGYAPQLAIDVDRDGVPELVREVWPARWIERLDPAGADEPAVLRQTSTPPSPSPLDCAWEQIPPLDIIDEVLHPRAPPRPVEVE